MPLGAFKSALFGASADLSSAMLLSTATASDDASIEFTLPTAYKQVKFGFYNINPATDGVTFQFQVNATDGADYNDSNITSTGFYAHHTEADASSLTYETGLHLAQSTSFQPLVLSMGNGADESYAGEMRLFNPSSTTFVKHFNSTGNVYATSDYTQNTFVSGYINNAASAITEISFKMSSGNVSSGTIKMWGIK